MARTLYLIDLENVVGHGCMTAFEAEHAWASLSAQLAIHLTDHTIVSTGRDSASRAAFAVQPHRFRIGCGPNGADLELLGVLQDEPVAQRYDRVVLVSGDGIFTDEVARLAGLGVHVVVASVADRLAGRLRMAAQDVVLLTVDLDVAA